MTQVRSDKRSGCRVPIYDSDMGVKKDAFCGIHLAWESSYFVVHGGRLRRRLPDCFRVEKLARVVVFDCVRYRARAPPHPENAVMLTEA